MRKVKRGEYLLNVVVYRKDCGGMCETMTKKIYIHRDHMEDDKNTFMKTITMISLSVIGKKLQLYVYSVNAHI
jgi:hypothetical protein